MTPMLELLLISIGLSLLLAVLYRFLTDPEEIRKAKREMEFYREKSKKAQKAGDMEEVKKLTNDMMKASQKQMSQTMKPMFASMVIFFVVLGWLATAYAELAIPAPFAIPFIGNSLNWFWWYLIIVIPANLVFRKALGVE